MFGRMIETNHLRMTGSPKLALWQPSHHKYRILQPSTEHNIMVSKLRMLKETNQLKITQPPKLAGQQPAHHTESIPQHRTENSNMVSRLRMLKEKDPLRMTLPVIGLCLANW